MFFLTFLFFPFTLSLSFLLPHFIFFYRSQQVNEQNCSNLCYIAHELSHQHLYISIKPQKSWLSSKLFVLGSHLNTTSEHPGQPIKVCSKRLSSNCYHHLYFFAFDLGNQAREDFLVVPNASPWFSRKEAQVHRA